jgi:hypothetical protein
MDELVERVRLALVAEYPGAPNGRVRDVPDRRAIRWYATTGLVDRPAAMRGRVALYGRRHLLQLVAVKRRQADGRTLAQIQAELAGATDATLAGIARVPDELLADSDPTPDGSATGRSSTHSPSTSGPSAGGPSTSSPSAGGPSTGSPAVDGPGGPVRTRFWASAPAAAAPPRGLAAAGVPAPTGDPAPANLDTAWTESHSITFAAGDPATAHRARAVPLAGVALDGGAILLLPGRPDDDDYAAIAAAARPLIALLAARGLLAAASTGGTTTTVSAPANPESGLLEFHDGSSR